MTQSEVSVWYRQKPIITKKQVEKITARATIKDRFRLLSRPSQYSVDGGSVIRYKEMDNKIFVMKRGTKL